MKQTIMMTALPIGKGDGSVRIAVFVSPRLEPAAPSTLNSFANFLSWPKTLLENLSFQVEVAGLGPIPATTSHAEDRKPSEEVWDSLFKAVTPVRAFAPKPMHTRAIKSYPVANVLTHIEGLYRTIAETSPTGLPVYVDGKDNGSSAALIDFVRDVGVLVGRVDRQRPKDSSSRGRDAKQTPMGQMLGEAIYAGKKVLDYDTQFNSLTPQQKKLADFSLAVSFHDRPGRQNHATDPAFSKLLPPELEFHEIVASLANFPEMLKLTGLVFELELQLGGKVLPKTGKIRVLPKFTTPAPAYNVMPQQPWTNYEIEGGRFMALAKPGGDLDNQMLVLANAGDRFLADKGKNPPRFALLQVDPDGAALKAVDFAMNFYRLRQQNLRYSNPDTAGLPALKTSGIGLIRNNRAYGVWQNLQDVNARNVAFNGGAAPDLYLDDILRGYRVDVLDESGEWFSLTQRVGYYHLTSPDPGYAGANPMQMTDEGFVRGASASSDLAGSSDLYLHEAMFRWEGWSLATPKPGKTIVRQESDPNLPPEVPEHRQNSNAGAAHIHMEANFKTVDKTLPRLRFGRNYRMRVRTVDLGGFGPTLKDAPVDPKYLSNALAYSRFEPVTQPFIVVRDKVREGESAERMVIRSNFDKKTADYSTYVLATYSAEFTPENSRWLAPPKTSQLNAESHGMFDEWIKAGEIEKAYHYSRKEEGTFLDVEIVDPTNPTTPIVVTGSKILNSPSTPVPPASEIKRKVLRAGEITNPAHDEVWRRGEPLAPGQYVIHTEAELLLPYLPDPIARGCSIEGLRDVSGNGVIPGGAPKVELGPFSAFDRTYKVVKIPYEGTWPDHKPFKIIIRERPGTINGDDCVETFVDSTVPPVWDAANRELIVYLGKAEVMKLRYSSYLDKSDLHKMGIWKWLDGSPRRNDFEPYGEAGVAWMVTPFRELTLVHAVQQPLCKPTIKNYKSEKLLGKTFATFRGEFEVNGPSTGRIDVKGVWTEWVDPLNESKPKQITGTAQVYFFDLPENSGNALKIPDAIPKPATEFRHEFNDTKYRKIDYSLLATTRFREYFPQSIWSDPTNISRVGEQYKGVKVLNSARPTMPKILYIIPTFGWQTPEPAGSGEIVSRRCGGGLRVYMDRPWYSSGDDELLGVVLYKGASTVPEDSALRPYVTQWGMDPIWASFPTYAYTQLAHFKSFETAGYDLSIDEVTGETVNVVGYTPGYDEDRKLWYCDIEVDAGPSYYPFIRLALARFQPNSVTHAHLSRVVMTDFAQLAADRAASITFTTNNAIMIYVSGTFGMNLATLESTDKVNALRYSRVVIATLEEPAGPTPGTMDWRPVGSGVATQLNPHYEKDFKFKMLWQGRMMLPGTLKRFGGTKTYRVVLTEWEYFDADDREGSEKMPNGRVMARRLVYADTIEI